ncbi:cell division protein FtsW [Bradyrhizobium embrapense]
MLARDQRTPFSDWWWTVDKLLLVAIAALMLAGVILSLAASPPVATRIGLDPFHFFNRHVMFLVPSLIVLIGVSFMTPRQIRRTALVVFVLSIALIVLTLLVGPEVKGSRRWITLLGVNIQASEAAKPAFVIVAAWLFAESTKRPEMPATSMALVLLMTLVSLLVMEPDFGQTMLITTVWGALFFIAGMRMIWVFGLAGAAGAGLFGAYLLVPHVAGRIKRFMNPASGDTFQVDTAMEAFWNGGWFGLGPGEGIAKRSLPDSHTDFVFAVAAEEFGIILCLMLVALFGFIVIRTLTRAYATEDMFSRFARVGACDPVRRAGDHQHGGQSATDPGQGHDAAVHLLWRLIIRVARLWRRHDACADTAAAAHRDRIDGRRQRPARLRVGDCDGGVG